MLKKILNKNLLVALVIGGSLGLTNAGMCTATFFGVERSDLSNGLRMSGNQIFNTLNLRQGENAEEKEYYSEFFSYFPKSKVDTHTSNTVCTWENYVKTFGKVGVTISDSKFFVGASIKNSLLALIVKNMVSVLNGNEEFKQKFKIFEVVGSKNYSFAIEELSESELDEIVNKKTEKANEIQAIIDNINGVKESLENIKTEMASFASVDYVNNIENSLNDEIKKVIDEINPLATKINSLESEVTTLKSNVAVPVNKINKKDKENTEKKRKELEEKKRKELDEKKRKENAEKKIEITRNVKLSYDDDL